MGNIQEQDKQQTNISDQQDFKIEENEKCCGEKSDKDTISIEKAMDMLKEVTKEKEEYLALSQRLKADFDNYKKRNQSAVSNAYDDAVGETIEKILPVLDNLERALESMKQGECPESFVQGIEMVVKQFREVLSKMDVHEIEALNKPFDPNIHHAVMQVEADEGQESDIIVEVLQKGYKHKEKVIRYSMVKVAK
ncbi:MAG: nucleotide exchange factor GrpE [Xylanivirga thermophila]|jgi:molecular chaperone GrpE|uniref:nucleotide exchange factor GrpE n=1 Tax=Xylanivirga thermophila TaxID=2496273 RepID=UPI0039F58699